MKILRRLKKKRNLVNNKYIYNIGYNYDRFRRSRNIKY